MKATNINSKESLLVHLRSLVPIAWKKCSKKVHSGVISQLHAIQATETPSVLHDLQALLSKHKMVFSSPQGLSPSRGVHDHSIPLVPGSLPPNIRPYRHPPFHKKIKLRKWSRNSLMQALSTLVRALTLLLYSWSLRKKVLGECVLTSVPSTN
jgi:hypothetical protein